MISTLYTTVPYSLLKTCMANSSMPSLEVGGVHVTSWYRGIDLTVFLNHLNPLQRCNQGRFNVIKPPRTAVQVPYTLTRCVGHLHTSLGWFDHIKPFLTPSPQRGQACTHQFGVVQSHRTIPNYLHKA